MRGSALLKVPLRESSGPELLGDLQNPWHLPENTTDKKFTPRLTQPFLWNFPNETLVGNSFGTRQQRKLFPHFHPPNFLGNKFLPLRGAPHRGPGSYMADDMTPYPGMYQTVTPREQKHKQNFAPFNTLLPRFRTCSKDTYDPGPGAYNPETKPPKKITWPMKFGSPDWAQVPCLQKRTLKAELSTDKDFRKHRNRVAYLSLFYS
ncbi:ciliary microtubule-associated protein 3 isoform X2 [Equus przewalskii]|uniref:Ciliary microtubule-associated protein 3 isoform X2 n=2 Tax=Equus TaxID=9789 RepID=A0ABM2EU92_EQUPR|nr:PREDICTED: protein pitchfork isoform X2 [Equus przewalskii]XP_014595595.1 protein pitchfork isoform X2 [Equus caballus]